MKNLVRLTMVVFLSIATTVMANAQNQKAFQIGFITPLGTNGANSHKVINNCSVNLLGGISQANNVFEFGGLFNINRDYTKGFQFAGLTNISGQLNKAAQFGGLANVVTQAQQGVQMAGILNVASEGKIGCQTSGFLNIAKNAGTQIGIINIADSVTGVPLGLINIVKKNGKQEVELGFSDAINTYASFKLGTDKFYTIFSGGINYFDRETEEFKTPDQFAVGLGFGTDITLANNYATQLELIGYGLTEDKKFTGDLHLLSQFKLTVSKQFNSGLKLYAGPVMNMTISQHKNADNQVVGSNLAPYTLYEFNNEKVDLKGWAGLTLGLRL